MSDTRTEIVTDVRQRLREENAEIADLCVIAGRPDMAAKFIFEGKTAAQVRQSLLAMQTEPVKPGLMAELAREKYGEKQA